VYELSIMQCISAKFFSVLHTQILRPWSAWIVLPLSSSMAVTSLEQDELLNYILHPTKNRSVHLTAAIFRPVGSYINMTRRCGVCPVYILVKEQLGMSL